MSHSALQEIVAVLGQNVAGNPTQYLMEKAFADTGLDWRCLTLEVAADDLGDAIRGLQAMGFRGCALATGHQAAAISHVDRVGQSAAIIGALNCIHRVDRELVGENTIGKGCWQSLADAIDPAGKHVLVLGAGRTARAIAVEAGLAGAAHFTIVNRDETRGQQLSELLSEQVHVPAQFLKWEGDLAIPPETEILIHATPIGSLDEDARVPLDMTTLEADMVVADANFNPPETRLIREARARGCTAIDGLAMLVQQAAIAFKTWTGQDANAEIMRDALEEFLGL